MLVTIEGKKGEERPITTSRRVAENFEKNHKDVLESIRNLKVAMSTAEFSALFYESSYKADNGKVNPEYLMTRDGFCLLAMGFTGAKALEWKLKYINAFNEMETTLKRIFEERKQWEIERAKGIVVRHILTDTIKNMIPDSSYKKFAYPTYTNLIYKVLFNKDTKQLKQDYKLQHGESVRDYLTADELSYVENLERLIAGLINLGWSYEQIKNFLIANVPKKIMEEMICTQLTN